MKNNILLIFMLAVTTLVATACGEDNTNQQMELEALRRMQAQGGTSSTVTLTTTNTATTTATTTVTSTVTASSTDSTRE